jgi:para-nitrobenzyl esterase
MPMARGLFQRAIVQSAAPEGQLSQQEAASRGRLFAEQLGQTTPDVAALRALPPEKILSAQSACVEPGPRRIGMFFAPFIDGEILPEAPLAAVAKGAARNIALIIGTTTDEMQLFTLVPGFAEIPEAALPQLVAMRLPGPPETALARAEQLLTHYPDAENAAQRFLAVETDASLFAPSTRLAEAQAEHQPQTFMYRFSWRSPFGSGNLGACHALDVPFALGTFDLPKLRDFAGSGPAAERVAGAMMDAWCAFAACGDPAHPGIQDWPPYGRRRRATFEFADPCRLLAAPAEARRRALSEPA